MKVSSKILLMSALLCAPAFISNSKATLITLNTSSMPDEERQVSNFNGISSSGSFSIFVTMGTKESLRLEGDPDIIKNIETVVENGVLKIKTTKTRKGLTWSWASGNNVRIYITAKTLNNLSMSGSGNLKVEGAIKARQFSTSISGSGNISLNSAEVEDYNSSISGSGKISIQGIANKATVKISGSGGFDGQNLKTSDAYIRVSGSGYTYIHAQKTLEAIISGSGKVRYSGQARVSSTQVGSGSISKM